MPKFIKVTTVDAEDGHADAWVNVDAITRVGMTPHGTTIFFGGFVISSGGGHGMRAGSQYHNDSIVVKESAQQIIEQIQGQ
jgi:hypothetical protein